MSIVIANWKSMTDDEIIIEAKKVVNDLTGNPIFTELQTEAAEVNTLVTGFSGALVDSKSGSHLDISIKNDKRIPLEDKLYILGLRVEVIAGKDVSKILSAGYKVRAESQKAGVLEAPHDVDVKAGPNSGSLFLSWKSVRGAKSYAIDVWEETETGKSNLVTLTSTKSSITIEGLTPGKKYGMDVAGVGSNPTRVKSKTITSYVM